MNAGRTAVLALLCGFAAAGCIEYDERAVVLPDGAGRIHVQITTPLQSGVLRESDRTPEAVAARALEEMEGLVAVTGARATRGGGKQTQEFTGWFDDIGHVRLGDHDAPLTGFEWTVEADACVLVAKLGRIKSAARSLLRLEERIASVPGITKERAASMRSFEHELHEGNRFRTEIRLPGKILSATGFDRIDDRTVALMLSDADLRDVEKLRRIAEQEFRVRCARPGEPSGEARALRKELAAARAAAGGDPATRRVLAQPLDSFDVEGEWADLVLLDDGDRFVFTRREAEGELTTLHDARGNEVLSLGVLEGDATDFPLSPDGHQLYVVRGTKGWLEARSASTGKVLWAYRAEDTERGRRPHVTVAVSGSGAVLVVVNNRTAVVLDPTTGKRTSTLIGERIAYAACPTSAPHVVIVDQGPGGKESFHAAFDVRSGKRLWKSAARVGGEPAVGWGSVSGREGRLLLGAATDPACELSAHDPLSGEERWRLPFRRGSLTMSRSGNHAISWHMRGRWLIDVRKGREIGRFVGLDDRGGPIGFGGADDVVRIIDFERGGGPTRATVRSFRLQLP